MHAPPTPAPYRTRVSVLAGQRRSPGPSLGPAWRPWSCGVSAQASLWGAGAGGSQDVSSSISSAHLLPAPLSGSRSRSRSWVAGITCQGLPLSRPRAQGSGAWTGASQQGPHVFCFQDTTPYIHGLYAMTPSPCSHSEVSWSERQGVDHPANDKQLCLQVRLYWSDISVSRLAGRPYWLASLWGPAP